MAARMFLSVLLDFFKCRKSILGQSAISAPVPQSLPPTEATPPAPCHTTAEAPTATATATAAAAADETTIDLPVTDCMEYDSVLNLELQLELEDELGYDDPRLPEMII